MWYQVNERWWCKATMQPSPMLAALSIACSHARPDSRSVFISVVEPEIAHKKSCSNITMPAAVPSHGW